MRNVGTSSASLVALLAASLANATVAPETYRLSSPWNVDYAQDSCALKGVFGNASSSIVLELQQSSQYDIFEATVVSSKFSGSLSNVKVRFLPDTEPHLVFQMAKLRFSDGSVGLTWIDSFLPLPPRPQSTTERSGQRDANEKAMTAIELSGSLKPTVLLATGQMSAPMEAVRKCIDDMVTHWGFDAAAQRALSKSVKPIDQGNWAQVLQDNYPRDMLAKKKGASVRVRLMVGADGRTSSCHTAIPSQEPVFENAACDVMMRVSRFEPALDASGKPIASYFVTRAVFDPD